MSFKGLIKFVSIKLATMKFAFPCQAIKANKLNIFIGTIYREKYIFEMKGENLQNYLEKWKRVSKETCV